MAQAGIPWNVAVVVLSAALVLESDVAAQDVCSKFQIDGPCTLLPSYSAPTIDVTPKNSSTENLYCTVACTQNNAEVLSKYCPCAAALTTTLKTTTTLVTTTPASTTTPRPLTCYYSTQRPARLNTVSRRLYSSEPAVPECEVPGILGFFYESNGKVSLACTGTLVSENVAVINEKNCVTWLKRMTIYVLTDSYKTADLSKNISIKRETIQKLDPTGTLGGLYTVQLTANLTFNTRCLQPLCFPNMNILATDIDFTDCSILGFGSTTASMTDPAPPELRQIKVTVGLGSVRKGNLTVTRQDKLANSGCMGDDGGPLICSHKYTREYVAVGLITGVGSPCDSGLRQSTIVANMMQESVNKAYYNGIQRFMYEDPNVFTALV